MDVKPAAPIAPDQGTQDFYVAALRSLDDAGVPYIVGGGYCMAHYTGIARNTKDLDLFVRPGDRDRTLTTLAAAGFRTEFFYHFWIAKALQGESFIDILYNSGNGLCPVDDAWFEHGDFVEMHGYRTRLCPPEEQLWSKAFVQDRDRFDGGDVLHLILARGKRFDWERLVDRFAGHEAVLLSHLILFDYVYPTERDCVPGWVTERLMSAARHAPRPAAKVCRGTLLAQRSYFPDIHEWRFADARLRPYGPLTAEEVAQLPPP